MESLIFPLLIALLAVPLFLQARKQKRAMQEQQKLQNSLTTGDRVMTTSGLYGTVVGTADDAIELEIAPGVTTTWARAAVREKVQTEGAAATGGTDEAAASDSDETGPETGSESKTQLAEPIEQQKPS